MKKILITLFAFSALVGCDQIDKAVEDTKQAVKDTAIETIKDTAVAIQEEMKAAGIPVENLDATQKIITELNQTIQDAQNMNLNDVEAVNQLQEKLSSSLSCLNSISPDLTSSVVDQVLNSITGDVNLEEVVKNSVQKSFSSKCNIDFSN